MTSLSTCSAWSIKIEDSFNISARTFHALILPQDDEGCVRPEFGLCPRLELIGLKRCDFEEGGSSVVRPFVDLLTSRWYTQGLRWLEEIYAEDCRMIGVMEDEQVRKSINDGLKLCMCEKIM